MYRFQGFVIDTEALELRSGDVTVPVEPQVFGLLLYLIENKNRVVSKDELIEVVWNGRIVSDATLNSRINLLRKAVGDSGKLQKVVKTYPKKGFRFVAELEGADPDQAKAVHDRIHGDRPAIVVLPFQYLSNNDDWAYLGHGISEEITTALSRMRWLFVISPISAVQYGDTSPNWTEMSDELEIDFALKGSVHVSGSSVRVSVQLVDALNGANVWADRFDGALEDIFNLQDEITYAVVSHLGPEITHSKIKRVSRSARPGTLSVWQQYLLAVSRMSRFERAENEIARQELNRVIKLDPEFVLPHVALAWCWVMAALHGWCKRGSEALNLSRQFARNALELDPGDARAHCAMAFSEFWVGNQEAAIDYARKSLSLDPNLTEANGVLGSALAVSGEPEKSEASLLRALKGSPRDPIRWFWHHGMANAKLAQKDYAQAILHADTALRTGSRLPQTQLVKAVSLALLGDSGEARRESQTIIERYPNFTIKRISRNPIWSDRETYERMISCASSIGIR